MIPASNGRNPTLCPALLPLKTDEKLTYGALLIERIKADARQAGFARRYLCTDHIGCYEHYGFAYIGTGYHPWGESSRIYCATTEI